MQYFFFFFIFLKLFGFFQPFLPTEELAISLRFCELISKDSFAHHTQWPLTETFHCAGAEAATLNIVYMVLLLSSHLGIANFLVMGVNKREPSLLWEYLNTSTEWKKMSLPAHWTNAKVNYSLVGGKFHSVNIWPGTSSAKSSEY